MEPAGHPTSDLVEELVARGAAFVEGDRTGPAPGAVDALPPGGGGWLWIPDSAFDTGFD